MRLEWRPLAERDFNWIVDDLASEGPQAAIDQGDALQRQVERLLEHPRLGRPGRVRGTRVLVVNRTPYSVAYQVRSTTITVLRVLHGAQQWPSTFR